MTTSTLEGTLVSAYLAARATLHAEATEEAQRAFLAARLDLVAFILEDGGSPAEDFRTMRRYFLDPGDGRLREEPMSLLVSPYALPALNHRRFAGWNRSRGSRSPALASPSGVNGVPSPS